MPLTCIRSAAFLNGPCSVRYSMMRCAAFSPTRGSSASCDASAVLMFTTPVGALPARPPWRPADAERDEGESEDVEGLPHWVLLLSFVGQLRFGLD